MEVHRFQTFDGKQEHSGAFSSTFCRGWGNRQTKPWMTHAQYPSPKKWQSKHMKHTETCFGGTLKKLTKTLCQETSFLFCGFFLMSSTKSVMSANMHRSGKFAATYLGLFFFSCVNLSWVPMFQLSWNHPRDFREWVAMSHARPILQSRSKPNLGWKHSK